ncbi:hypothetical protein [Actinokineospora inagensis]|uniref:hypothetical protein n=1 Tax=Actinokineospora inagensis TaxID=103730 RepID=UPI00146FA650|nr:hypothetical protein [Actinokineospora inagensis]
MTACRERGIPFSIHTVITTGTVSVLPSMVDFAVEHGARKISFVPVVPRGRAARGPDEISGSALTAVRAEVADLARVHSGRMVVRCVDFWDHDYWVIENDGVLWIERSRESLDSRVCDLSDLLAMWPVT